MQVLHVDELPVLQADVDESEGVETLEAFEGGEVLDPQPVDLQRGQSAEHGELPKHLSRRLPEPFATEPGPFHPSERRPEDEAQRGLPADELAPRVLERLQHLLLIADLTDLLRQKDEDQAMCGVHGRVRRRSRWKVYGGGVSTVGILEWH
jgi:hypothetical protein